jgi:hypothetical protein
VPDDHRQILLAIMTGLAVNEMLRRVTLARA